MFGWLGLVTEVDMARARAMIRAHNRETVRQHEEKDMSDFEVEKQGSDFEVVRDASLVMKLCAECKREYSDVYGECPFCRDATRRGASAEGRKDDAAKDRFELLPGDALRAIAVILTLGAAKYGDRNWEKGMKWSRVYGALQRHLNDWWQGEALDAETGKSHLAHAGCCLLFLIAYEIRSVGEDDRPKRS